MFSAAQFGSLIRQQLPRVKAFPAFNLQRTQDFSKYLSKARTKRQPLTTKKAGKGYYKGNQSRKEGFLTSKGKFVRIRELCTELVVPDFTNFNLKPYVSTEALRHKI